MMLKKLRAVVDAEPRFFRLVPAIVALRLAVYIFIFVLFRMTVGGQPGFWDTFEKLWTRWDVEHYLYIAQHGYVTEPGHAKNIAFFPMYPALVGVTAAVLRFIPIVVVAMLISNLAALGGLYFLHRLVKLRFDEDAADRAVIYAACFPTAYFFGTAYTEGLFFLFVVAAFYFLERESWFEASLFAAFAAGTRLTGVLVGIAAFAHLMRQKKWKPGREVLWVLLLAPAGTLLYFGINWAVWGDPLRFLEFQRTAWFHESATPIRGFSIVINDYLLNPQRELRSWWYRDIMELIAALIGYALAVVTLWRLGLAWGIYVLGSVLLWTSNTWWMSGPRFLLVLFPLFVWLATRKWSPSTHTAIWAVTLVAQIIFAVVFTSGSWAF